MQLNPNEMSAFAFQMDLVKLNLNLGEAEHSSEPQTRAYAAALAQIRTLDAKSS